MIIAIFAWLLAALVSLLLLRRLICFAADPLVFENLSIPFSSALLAVMCAADMIPFEKLALFAAVLLGYLIGGRTAGAFFGREAFRLAIVKTVSRFMLSEIYFILIATMAVTVVLTVLAVQAGGLGDGRQAFARSFRPLAILHSGLFRFSLVILLSPRLSTKQVCFWLGTLILMSIPFSGKGVFVPVLYWVGMKYFVLDKRVGIIALGALSAVTLIGVAIMGALAYVYAYKLDALAMIRGDYKVAFSSYMLHPITSLVGVRAYEKPLGAMLMSQVEQRDVLTGPNPQLPVLLDFFFPNQLALCVTIAFCIGLAVFLIRPAGIAVSRARSRYLALGGVTAALFCSASGFVDTSQVLIGLVSMFVVTVAGIVFELASSPGEKPPRVAGIIPTMVSLQRNHYDNQDGGSAA
jgi:hypothetical protein